MSRKLALISLFLWFSATVNSSVLPLDKVSHIRNGFLGLGEDFFVRCVMKPVEGAKLILFNSEAAKELGIKVPSDSEIEQSVLKQFALMVEECEPRDGSKKLPNVTTFATRYHDSNESGESVPHGDGRAVWVSEIEGPQKLKLDVVLKGVGRTTLAKTMATNASADEKAHNDGLQSFNEGIYSYIVSEINRKNHIDGPRDLAVILLPKSIQKREGDKHGAKEVRATITVRIGQQTRMGHLAYFFVYRNADHFKKMLNHVVKRAGAKDLSEYLNLFSRNLAMQAAQLQDLLALHGSLTRGNMTTLGELIDFSTFEYLQNYPLNVSFEEKNSKDFSKQKSAILDYIKDLKSYVKIVPELQLDSAFKLIEEKVEAIYKKVFQHLLLFRLGLEPELIDSIFSEYWLEAIKVVGELTDNFNKVANFVPAGQDRRELAKENINIRALIEVLSKAFADTKAAPDLKTFVDEEELVKVLCPMPRPFPNPLLCGQIISEIGYVASTKVIAENKKLFHRYVFNLFSNLRSLAEVISKKQHVGVQALLIKWATAAALRNQNRPSPKTRELVEKKISDQGVVGKIESNLEALKSIRDDVVKSYTDEQLYDLSRLNVARD